jgi:hypothetical protein
MPYLLLVEQSDSSYSVMKMEGTPEKELEIWGYEPTNEEIIYAPFGTLGKNGRYDGNFNHIGKGAFEADLSISLLNNSRIFRETLNRLGRRIAHALETEYEFKASMRRHERFISEIGTVFKNYFYTDKDFFGKLGNAQKDLDTFTAYKIGLSILKSGKKIEEMLFAHMAVARIFSSIPFEVPQNQKYKGVIREKGQQVRGNLFANRCRIPKEENLKREATSRVGYLTIPYDVGFNLPLHTRAADLYSRDDDNVSDFCWNSWIKEIPYVAGPSGSTAECLSIFLTFYPRDESFDKALQEYSACCVAYLVGSGAHSFHEVMSIAKNGGAVYREASYVEALPISFLQSPAYSKLEKDFPDLLQRKSATNIGDLISFTIFTPDRKKRKDITSAPNQNMNEFERNDAIRKAEDDAIGRSVKRSKIRENDNDNSQIGDIEEMKL